MPDEWLRLTIEQAIETFRFLVGLATTVFGFLIAADAALLLYGLQNHYRPALFLAALAMAACTGVWLVIGRSLAILAFIAARAEVDAQLANPGLVQTYATLLRPSRAAALMTAASDPDRYNPIYLRNLGRSVLLGRGVAAVLFTCTLAQVIFACVAIR